MSRTLFLACLVLMTIYGYAYAATDPTSFKGTIDWLVWGDPTSNDIDNQVIAAFERHYPNIKVNLINGGSGGSNDKFLAMVLAGTPPDLAIIDSYNIADHVYKGLVTDVTDWAARDGIKGVDTVPAFWQEMILNGRLYSVANVRSGSLIILYNQNAFDELGLINPSTSKNWNWNTFMEASSRLTRDKDGDGVSELKAIDPSDWAAWPWVWMAGGELLNKEMTRTVLDEPNAMRGLQFVTDLHQRGYTSSGEILGGKIHMKIDWPTTRIATYRKQATFDWDIAPLPTGPNGLITAVKGNPVCIPVGAKNKELAWEFMKFLGGEEAQYIYGSLGRFFPNNRRAGQRLVSEAKASNLAPANLMLLISNMTARPLPLMPGFSGVRTMIRDELKLAYAGTKSVYEAAVSIGSRSEAILADAKKAR